MPTKRLTQAELAKALGVNKSSVTRAVRAGRVTPGADGLFDLEEARKEWRANTRLHLPREAGGYEYWRQQKVAYQARIAELDFRRKAGELFEKERVDYALLDVATSFRVAMEALADRLAPIVAPLTDQDEIRRIVKHELERIVADLEAHVARVRNELERDTP
jgi:transcriptional regulator with XRE-family HTH domain